MQNKFVIVGLLLVLAACRNPKNDEKVIQDIVMAEHETVMTNDEFLTQKKMKLDTLIMKRDSLKKENPALDTFTENKKIHDLSNKIVKTQDVMSDWMHNYNPDFKGKSHDEIMKYLFQQKKQIQQINAQYNSVIHESNQYLLKYKKK